MSKRLFLLTVFSFSLMGWIVRIWLCNHFIGLDTPIDPHLDGLDEYDYELFAYQLSIGAGYTLENGAATARRAPGTSLTLLPVYFIMGRSYVWGRIWFTFLSALIIPILAWLVNSLWGRKSAICAAFIATFHPVLAYYALHLWSETPCILIILLGTIFTRNAIEHAMTCSSQEPVNHSDVSPSQLRQRLQQLLQSVSHINWQTMLAGCCWGFAILIRPQLLLFTGSLCCMPWLLPRKFRLPVLIQVLTQVAVAILIVTPWVTRNYFVMGKPALATVVGGCTFWGVHNDLTFTQPELRGTWIPLGQLLDAEHRLSQDELKCDEQAYQYGWESLNRHRSLISVMLFAKLFRLVTPFEATSNVIIYWTFAISWMLMIVWILPGFWLIWQTDRTLAWLLCLHLLALLACTLIYYGNMRFRHVYEPFFILCLVSCFRYLGSLRHRKEGITEQISTT